MAYGTDVSVYVEDIAGDLGAPSSQFPWWLSPDVDIPAHSGTAVQGTNDVQIRVHAQDEPFLEEKVVAEVYVGAPGFVLSPTVGTRRIDPGNLLFRPPGVTGTEPILTTGGATLTFPWVPSADADIDGPGHRCLIVRAFPQSVTPPTAAFDVPNEQHEAQHNIEVLSTSMDTGSMDEGGAGTGDDPRQRDEGTGMWWERLRTLGSKRGRHFIVWAFDPDPSKQLLAGVRRGLNEVGVRGMAKGPPRALGLEARGGKEVDPKSLVKRTRFAKRSGIGKGLFAQKRLLAAMAVELGPKRPTHVMLRFDHSNIRKGTALVLHGAQWDETGRPEGGMTIVAVAPTG